MKHTWNINMHSIFEFHIKTNKHWNNKNQKQKKNIVKIESKPCTLKTYNCFAHLQFSILHTVTWFGLFKHKRISMKDIMTELRNKYFSRNWTTFCNREIMKREHRRRHDAVYFFLENELHSQRRERERDRKKNYSRNISNYFIIYEYPDRYWKLNFIFGPMKPHSVCLKL